MYLDDFHSINQNIVNITPEQASRFAKEVSGDFNPLHNPEAKKFCVPGDLLFSLILSHFGLSQVMSFHYTGMIGRNVDLIFPKKIANNFTLSDNKGKNYLTLEQSGSSSKNEALIENFSRSYVAFSGHSFPHILVPLLKSKQVMINPARPMVIYESMGFEFNHLSIKSPMLKLAQSHLEVTGKRGSVRINFDIMDGNSNVGKGFKTMIISGLRPYNQQEMDNLIALYEDSKQSYAKYK